MATRLEGVNHMVAVFSGKGGVGKTTVAVNLALALAEGGRRVGLFDADVYGPNVPLMLGVRRRETAPGMLPVARARKEPYITPLERYGLRVMSIGFVVGERDPVRLDPRFAGMLVRQTLADVKWAPLDYLVIDFPPGTGEPQQTLVREVALDGVVVVTTPQDLSLLDASRTLGVFREANVPILGVVENMSFLTCPHCNERVEVFHRSARTWAVEDPGVEVLGRVPMNINISRGIDAGHPLVQSSPEAAEAAVFRGIARRIAARLKGLDGLLKDN